MVVTTVSNIPDVIENGASGLLVLPRNIAGLTQALARMFDDPALRKSLMRSGHDKPRGEFSVEPAAARLIDGIQDALISNKPTIHERKIV